MRVAIVHYHLDPGGVTSVIARASHGLTARGIQHVILSGSAPPGPLGLPAPIYQVNGLGYLRAPGDLTGAGLADNLLAAATHAFGAPPDVWHFHNHSLGKNAILPDAISHLIAGGARVLFQIHDLAEDGRPANYSLVANQKDLYPVSPRVQYAFLNSRDFTLFAQAGLPPGSGNLLPNPVPLPSLPPSSPSGSPPLLFAPIRGIRRKNIGELVLLAALAPAGTRVAISRAPKDPLAFALHDTWSRFAERHHIPIGFDVVDRCSPEPGADPSFESWQDHATHIVSTSVAEGFGMSFLESIARGRPLLGRNLPHLAHDHALGGLHFPHLYDQILVPVTWIDLALLRDHLMTSMERAWRDYGVPLSALAIEEALEAIVQDNLVDFGNLPEALQQGVIERLAHPLERAVPLASTGKSTRPLIDWLEDALSDRRAAVPLEALAPWSVRNHTAQLCSIYQKLVAATDSAAHGSIPHERILSQILSPRTFHFLRSSPPPLSAGRRFKAVIFDIYGTLLTAPSGGVKPDPLADPVIREVLRQHGHEPPASPSASLHASVLRHHAASGEPYPEIDLRMLWQEILHLTPGTDTTDLVKAIEDAWHPATAIPGATSFIRRLSRAGIPMGILSNAQSNTLASLGELAEFFSPEFTVLSYQCGIAKPSPALFQLLAERLAARGITAAETLYIGNDPLNDILPASATGFATALYTGHPDSIRPGDCRPDFRFQSYRTLDPWLGISP